MSYVEIYNERLHDLLQPYKPNARLDPQVATFAVLIVSVWILSLKTGSQIIDMQLQAKPP